MFAQLGDIQFELITYFNQVAKAEKDLRNIIVWVSATTGSAVIIWIVVDKAIKKAEEEEKRQKDAKRPIPRKLQNPKLTVLLRM